MERISVLVVDDDETLQKLLEMALLAEGYVVTTSSSAEEALEISVSGAFDLVITDIGLPGMDGLAMMQAMKAQRPEVQVIVMTGASSLGSALTAFRAGTFDYHIKPFRLASMSSCVRRVTEKIRREREQACTVERLLRSHKDLEEINRLLIGMAIRDGLTGLYNYRYFRDRLEIETVRALRQGSSFSLIFLDVDHFKNYNDSNGHVDGDGVLRQIAESLRSRFRKTDLIARYGGEEFIILLTETAADTAFALAEETRRLIEEHPFAGAANQPGGKLTVSMGIAAFPENGTDAESLLRRADAALYRAKTAGRNRICRA